MTTVEYKNYSIEAYHEERLVGGPYENNEERQYRRTGNILYRVTPLKKNLPKPGHQMRSQATVEAAKMLIDHLVNKKRTKQLQRQHELARIRFIELGDTLSWLENELAAVGAPYNGPNIYGKYEK